MSRIFLSHSSRDNPLAVRVRDWLRENGWDDVFLDIDPVAGLAPGENWQMALKVAADRCEAVLFIITPNWLASPWCLSEFLLAKQLGKRLFPLTASGATIAGLPPEISSDHQAVDIEGDPFGFDRLKEGLRRAGLGANTFAFERGRRPYPGFAPLSEKDAAIFFGRAAQIVRGLDRLRLLRDAGAERMLIVLGASGAGKSSFLRAGLWPRLQRDDRNFLPLAVIRPERAPLSGKAGLFAVLEQALADRRAKPGAELAALPRSRAGLADHASREGHFADVVQALRRSAVALPGGIEAPPTVVLTIDQGEELMNPEAREEAERFFDLIAATLKRADGLIVVLAVRSDAFPQFQAEPKLETVARATFDLPPMPEGSLRLVIEGPAALSQPPVELDPALTDALLADATGQDALPLLAFSLDRLMREYGAEGRLTLENYHASGGVRGAITAAVEEALAQARVRGAAPSDPAALDGLIKQAFIPHLARVNEAGEFARRIAYTAEIPAAALGLVDMLVEARLLTRGRDEKGEIVEVAHEALLREWPKLRGFLEADREFLTGKRQLADDVAIWRDAPPAAKRDALLSGLKLARAQTWLAERAAQDLSDEERAFIGESLKAASRARRRRNLLAFVAMAALVVFSVFAGYQTLVANREAEAARASAERAEQQSARANASEADAKQSAAQALAAQRLAETNEKAAKSNEARALVAQARAQQQESLSLVDRSLAEGAAGDAASAMRDALRALPADPLHPDRPYVARADFALAKALAEDRLIYTLTPSADRINRAVLSPDGKTMAVATRDGFLKLYAAEDGRELNAVATNRMAVYNLAYTPDGRKLVTLHQEPPSLVVWDAARMERLHEVRLATPLYDIEIARGGAVVAVYGGLPSSRAYLVQIDEGTVKALDLGLTGMDSVHAFRLSADGALAVALSYHSLSIWDGRTGALLSRHDQDAAASGARPDFSDYNERESIVDGRFIAKTNNVALLGDEMVYVVDAPTGEIRRHWRYRENHSFRPRGLALSENGDAIAFPIDKMTLGWFTLAGGQLIAKREIPSPLKEITLSPDGKQAAATSEDKTLRLWSVGVDAPVVLTSATAGVNAATVDWSGGRAIGYGEKLLHMWDIRPLAARLSWLDDGLEAKAFDTSLARFLASPTGSGDPAHSPPCSLRRFDNGSVTTSAALTALCGSMGDARFSPSGKWVAISATIYNWRSEDPDGARAHLLQALKADAGQTFNVESEEKDALDLLVVLDADTGKVVHALRRADAASIERVDFLADDGVIVGVIETIEISDSNYRKQAKVYDLKTGEAIFESAHDRSARNLEFAESDQVVVATTMADESATGADTYETTLYSLQARKPIAQYPLPVWFKTDDALLRRHLLLLGSSSHTPRLVSTRTGAEVGAIADRAWGATDVTVSRDGERLLVEWPGANAGVWDLGAGALIGEVSTPDAQWRRTAFAAQTEKVTTFAMRRDHAEVSVYDARTAKLLNTLIKPKDSLNAYLGEAGRRIATQTGARSFDIDDLESSRTSQVAVASNLARWRFMAKDERLVAVDRAGDLKIYDTADGAVTATLSGVDTADPLGEAAPAGDALPVLLADGRVIVLDVRSGREIWRSPDDDRYNGAALAPNGEAVVVKSTGATRAFRLSDGKLIAAITGAPEDKISHQFSENGERLFLSNRGASPRAALYDTRAPRRLLEIEGAGLAQMSERSGAIAVSAGKTITLYDAESGAQRRSVTLDAEPVEFRFSAAGDRIAIRAEGFRIYSLDVAGSAPKLVTTLNARPKFIYAPADSRRLLVMAASGRVHLYDAETGRIAARVSAPWNRSGSSGWEARLNKDASRITLRTPDNLLRGYRTDDGMKLLDRHWSGQKFADAMPLDDGDRFVMASETGQLVVRAADSENDANEISFALSRQFPSSVRDSVLSATADPSRFLTVDGEGRVDLFSTALRSYQTFYAGAPERDLQAELSPDGSLLATVGENSRLRLWHVAANELLVEIPDISRYSRDRPSFTAGGGFLIVGSGSDAKILRVPLTGSAAMSEARRRTAALPGTASSPSQSDTPQPGVVVAELAADQVERLRISGGRGVLIAAVTPGGPAEAAGLKVGDVILRIDEVEVASPPEAYAALKKASGFCNVVALRKGKDLAARLILTR